MESGQTGVACGKYNPTFWVHLYLLYPKHKITTGQNSMS
jgi:hypothetical protein